VSATLIALTAVVAAFALIVGIVRFSMWLTDRKSTEELKRQIPDASSSNSGGFHVPVDPV